MKKTFRGIIPVLVCMIILCAAAAISFAGEAPTIIKTGEFTIELFNEQNQQISLTESQENDYTVFKADLESGTYQYKAYGKEENHEFLGGGQLHLDTDREIVLRQIDFDGNIRTNDGNGYNMNAYHIQIKDQDEAQTFKAGSSGKSFVLPAYNSKAYYLYEFVPDDRDTYWGSAGKLYVYQSAKKDTLANLNLSDSGKYLVVPKISIAVQVPDNLDFKIYHRVKFYRPLEEIKLTLTKNENNTNYYTCDVPVGEKLHYELKEAGKVTRDVIFYSYPDSYSLEKPLIVEGDMKDLSGNEEIRGDSQNGCEANLFLNVPDSKHISLNVGETFEITAFRSWQIVDDAAANYYVDPEYHYAVMEGDGAVEVDEENGVITAVKKGTSVVKVTYDPLEYITGGSRTSMLYSGIWRENIGIIVVTVGDSPESYQINPKISVGEFDTIYFIKNENGTAKDTYANYSFLPTADHEITSVRVQKPFQTDWNEGWENGVKKSDGTYEVKIYEGSNIVEISAGEYKTYYVIRGQGLDVSIDNLTHPEQEIRVGDRIAISFEGLKLPVPKLAAIYNPGYPDKEWVEYKLNETTVRSKGSQYTLPQKAANKIELIADEAGKLILRDGRVHTNVFGAGNGGHRLVNSKGSMEPYLDKGAVDSPEREGYYSILPDITIHVKSPQTVEKEEKQNFCSLTELIFGHGISESPSFAALYKGIVPENLFACWPTMFRVKAVPYNSEKVEVKYFLDGEETTIPASYSVSVKNKKRLEIVVSPKNEKDGYTKKYVINLLNGKQVTNTAYRDLTLEVSGQLNGSKESYIVESASHDAFGLLTDNACVYVPYNLTEVTLKATLTLKGGGLINKSKNNGSATDILTINGNSAPQGEQQTQNNKLENEQSIQLEKETTEVPIKFETTHYDNKGKQLSTGTYAYTVKIIKEAPPKEVKIQNLKAGASVTIKDSGNKTVAADSNGIYSLTTGEYRYFVICDGYETIAGTWKITTDDASRSLQLPDMVKLPKQTGSVQVSVTAYNSIVKPVSTVLIKEPEDLTKDKYVEYNHGGYTALHAVIEAMGNSVSKSEFTCWKGKLTPKNVTNPADKGNNAGWVCEINDKVCNDPANTLVNGGDIVEYYYNADYEGMQHATFAENVQQTLTAENSLTLTLLSKNVGTDDEKTACASAEILLNGQSIGLTTDAEGKVTIPADKISTPGKYTITASKKNASDQNILTYTACILTVKKTDTQQPTGKTTVTFRLIGDAVHSAGSSNHSKYVTWIATRSYTFNKESVSVYELFTKALRDAGLSHIGAENNYVSAIQAPKGYGGYWLREFTNGKNSGWMYTVNGEHPLFGLKDYYVTNGDSIVWHYVDDYQLETSFEGSIPTYPNRWLEAEDTDPPTDKVIDMSGKNDAKDVTTSGAAGSATTTAPTEVKVSGTTATATVKAENQSEILKQAAENKSAEIILEVSKADSKGADSVQLSLDVTFVKNVADKTNADLTVNTENGKVTLDQETIKTVLAEAKGATITLEVTKVSKPTEVQKKAAGANGHLLKLTIKSGDKVISDFNKGKVKVVAEIVSKLLDKKVAAIHIADDGKIEQLAGRVLTIGGKKYYEFTTPHFSTFALVDADELGLEVKEEPAVDAKALTAKLTPVARSAKTAKKNVKVTTSLDKQDKAIVQELKDAGYTVKYRFYRSTKKAAGYKAAVTKKTSTYTNTGGKKGTKYYYKVQVRVYDTDGKLAAKTALKQCKYASRAWSR